MINLKDTIHRNAGALITICLAFLFVFTFYGEVILHPNSYLYSAGADGVATYFAYSTFIDNNTFSTDLESISYPYGEELLFRSGFPLLAFNIKALSTIIPWLSSSKIGIVNFLIMISFVVSALFSYLVLREFKVSKLVAIGGAICVMYLCPQVFRVAAHMSLSFSCFLPISWFLLLKFERSNKKKKYAILNCINGLFWVFMHAYLGTILASFIISYGIVKSVSDIRERSIDWKYYSWLGLQALFPVIVFLIFSKMTDSHVGRTTNPFGFFTYHADFGSVFLPNREPLGPFFKQLFPNNAPHWEGVSYVGVVSLVSLALLIFATLKRWVRRGTSDFRERYFPHPHLRTMLIGSVVVLAFSMSYPFRWNMHSLLDYFGFIKQFRSTGRFAWVFYFVVNIAALVVIDRIVQEAILHKKKLLAYFLLVLMFVLYGREGYSYHEKESKLIVISPNLFDVDQVDDDFRNALSAIEKDNFQAIIPFPYYVTGSANFHWSGTSESSILSKTLSYYTTLPIMAANSARGSILESKKLIQLLTPNYYDKELEKDITDNRDFLMVVSENGLRDCERRIISNAKLIYSAEKFKLFSISKEKLFEKKNSFEIEQFLGMQDSLIDQNGFLSTASTYIFFKDYEDSPSKNAFRGSGAYHAENINWHILANIPKENFSEGREYNFRFWMYCGGENYGQDMLKGMVVVTSIVDGKEKWKKVTLASDIETIVGDWVMYDITFDYDKQDKGIKLMIRGDDVNKNKIYIDDLMLFQKGTVHYRIDKDENGKVKELFKNNHRIVTQGKPLSL